MIQTTAPTPSAAPIGAIAAALAPPIGATTPDATFAALLDGTGEPATPEHTLHTGEFTPAMPEVADATAKTLKDGLAALALQAGAATLPRHTPCAGVPAGTPIMPPGATVPTPAATRDPQPESASPEGRPAIVASHAALAAAIALPMLRPGGDVPAAILVPKPSRETPPGPDQLLADAVSKVEAPGGKDNGNILPDGTARPVPAEALAAVLPSTPILPASGATEPLATLPPSVAPAPGRQEPIIDTAPRATAPLAEAVRPNTTPLAASAIRPAAMTSIPSPEVSTIRFERIDVVRAEPRAIPNAPLAPAAMPVASAPVASAPPAQTGHGLTSAALESLPPIAAPSLKARPGMNAAPAPRPAAPIEPAVPSVNMPVTAQTTVIAATDDAHPATIPTAARGDETAERLSIKPRDSDAAAIRPLPTTVQHTAPVVPTLAEAVPAITGAIEATTSTPPADAPHDFDTLVTRLGEARDAAAPHLVRTVFEHAEFGRVAMQLRHEDGGLAVTLASHDPEFTGAVQAVAASMAGGSASNSDQPRHDNPAPQQGQSQNTAQANAGGQSQQQARADASGQQARREGGSQPSARQDQPQSGSSQRGREQRSGGSDVYA